MNGPALCIDWSKRTTPPSEFEIGGGVLGHLGTMLTSRGLALGGRVLLVCDPAATAAIATVEASLARAGLSWRRIDQPAGESLKVQASVDRIVAEAIEWGVDRETPLVAVGGGCVCDLAAFAASVLLRGVPLILVPTTLLAIVDASIGGKTAINVPLADGGLGRNLVGSFHPAQLVVSDPDTLATLPARELRSGLGECLKHAMIEGEKAIAALERDAGAISTAIETGRFGAPALVRLMARSVAKKVEIVAIDPLERSGRAALNLGHTFAHAIEAAPGQPWLHGEAVGLGLLSAMAAAEHLGRVAPDDVARIAELLVDLGLPMHWSPPHPPRERLRSWMTLDKKGRGGRLRLVLPHASNGVGVVEDPPEQAVTNGWSVIGVV